MSRYDEEFYNEPSEFELKYEEFKQLLIDVVKADYLTEMSRLRKENAELLIVKSNLSKIENDFKSKERQFEYDRKDLERNIRKERLNQLMADFQIVLYTARSNRVMPPKCNKCDEKRKITYTTPLGKLAQEDCECNAGKQVYYPQEFDCTEFYIERDGSKLGGIYNKRDYSDDGYRSSGMSLDDLYQVGADYEKLNYYRTMFRTKEECQKYCDWLTEKRNAND